MNIDDIKKKNLKHIFQSKCDSSREMFAKKLGYDGMGYTNGLLNGSNTLGKGIVSKIEAAFNLPDGWLYIPHDNGNTEPAPAPIRKLPLISWVHAGVQEEIQDLYHPGDHEDLIRVDRIYSKHSFALRVKGDSMEPVFTEGHIVCIDPEVQYENGDYIVAKFPASNEAILRKYSIQGNRHLLVPLNDRYPVDEIDESVLVCGVVLQSIQNHK